MNHYTPQKATIRAIGHFVPDQVLSNQDLEQIIDTSDEWIMDRVGIKERRIAPKDKPTSWLAINACQKLIKDYAIDVKTIECIIVATITPDMMFPNTSNALATAIGAVNAWTQDILAACSGFVYALSQATVLIESGRYKRVLVVGADKMSSIVDYTDRNTCILFGDAAGAVLVESAQEKEGYIEDFILKTETDMDDTLLLKGGGSKKPASIQSVMDKSHYIYQNGRAVFKKAIYHMSNVIQQIMDRNNLSCNDIDWLCPHQANRRIIQNVGDNFNIPTERIMVTIHKYGNTTAATIPLCLSEYSDQLEKGQRIIMSSFGAGYTWGSCFLRWNI